MRIEIEIEEQAFEVLWQDHGPKLKLILFHNGKQLGSKEFSHLTDQGQGVIEYAVKAILRESNVATKSN